MTDEVIERVVVLRGGRKMRIDCASVDLVPLLRLGPVGPIRAAVLASGGGRVTIDRDDRAARLVGEKAMRSPST